MDMQLIGEELLPQSEADKIEAMLQELKVSLFIIINNFLFNHFVGDTHVMQFFYCVISAAGKNICT